MNRTLKHIILVSTLTTITIGPADTARAGGPNNGPAVASELDDSEAAKLLFIREEEKLARDVYLAMHTLWGLPVFAQIAESEQEHMDAIKRMLDKYGLPDPALGIGMFDDDAIQALYDGLIDSGSTSELNALKAGGFIEEFDIHDLLLAIGATDNPDLQRVYGELEAGSENHLRAFAGQIEARTGEPYAALYLDQATVDEILAATSESGQRERNRAW